MFSSANVTVAGGSSLTGSVSHDESCDASYAVILPGPKITRTVEMIPGRLMLDLDAEGRLIGVEVLDVNQPLIPPEENS